MFEMFYYLLGLIVGITGLAVIDYRYKLAFWKDRRSTLLTIGSGVAVFLIWDILGINFDIFFPGGSRYVIGLNLLPSLPVEELFFLTLLCYTTLLLYLGGKKRWPRI